MNQILFSQDSPKTYDMESNSSKGPIRYRPGFPFQTSVFYPFFLSHDPQPQWHSTFQSKRTGVFCLEEFFFAHLLVRTLGSQIFTWLNPPVTQTSVQITLLRKAFLATSANAPITSLDRTACVFLPLQNTWTFLTYLFAFMALTITRL